MKFLTNFKFISYFRLKSKRKLKSNETAIFGEVKTLISADLAVTSDFKTLPLNVNINSNDSN